MSADKQFSQFLAHMYYGKIVVKILQGTVVTQTVLGGLTIILLVANFLLYICAKNDENLLAADKTIAVI